MTHCWTVAGLSQFFACRVENTQRSDAAKRQLRRERGLAAIVTIT
jgi:hypothetical protein